MAWHLRTSTPLDSGKDSYIPTAGFDIHGRCYEYHQFMLVIWAHNLVSCNMVSENRTADYSKKSVKGSIAAATVNFQNNSNFIDCYSESLIDTACSYHAVNSLHLLERNTITQTCERLKAANGKVINLTHMGKRQIRTKFGELHLNEVYYAKELTYNLISVPKLITRGVEVVPKP